MLKTSDRTCFSNSFPVLATSFFLVVFESCVSELGGVLLGVPHGEYAVDAANCRRCLCNDGNLVECEPAQNCENIQSNPVGCEYDGRMTSHGEQFDVGPIYSSSYTLV